ncbi:MAG TPA: diapophytoene dehydrogenase [Bacteroidales bacterium]|nr:diapophytoene dehydrogenase [Bacteroidales bacterium]
MAEFKLIMPKLGESVQEATITKWFVKENDRIEEDDRLLEIATDKVDSEIPSPVDGVVTKIFYPKDALVPVGEVIALIRTSDDDSTQEKTSQPTSNQATASETKSVSAPDSQIEDINHTSDRFYSPLVKSIAKTEGIGFEELEAIKGTGNNDRVTKTDVLKYVENRGSQKTAQTPAPAAQVVQTPAAAATTAQQKPNKVHVSVSANDEIVEMDRMRKMIGDHMIMSKQVSPHVTSMVEADVTNIVLWRDKIKDAFQKREGEKITYLPIILEAIVKAMKDYPWVNASVDGDRIIIRKNYNIGVAVALPTGNLIVPVIKKADQLNIVGLTKELNRLANAARENKLTPDDISGGTFSVSNFGTFRNVMGTPIINQPQVAIMAVGTIEKKPAVIETPTGDIIGIRHKMFLSLSYDHRVVDGALGGAYLRKVADYLEEFDMNRTF